MKRIFILLIAALLFSCSQSKLPVESTNSGNASTEQWAPVFSKAGVSLHKAVYLSKEIDGTVGGLITYKATMDSGVKLDYQLQFLPGSFDGVKTISVSLDDNSFIGEYAPHGYFYKPAILSIKVKNADLSFISDDDDLHFVYMSSDGHLEFIDHRKLRINIDRGILDLRNAEIPHFSRYGFTR